MPISVNFGTPSCRYGLPRSQISDMAANTVEVPISFKFQNPHVPISVASTLYPYRNSNKNIYIWNMLPEDFITNIYERVQLWRYLCVRGTIRKNRRWYHYFSRDFSRAPRTASCHRTGRTRGTVPVPSQMGGTYKYRYQWYLGTRNSSNVDSM